jgi:alpha-D-ribose 1-methylphosphonate 5-triphosphate diphosphatase
MQWDNLAALKADDAVIVAGGTTPDFDNLCDGASMQRPERRGLLVPLVAALERSRAAGLCRADHLTHQRCGICGPDAVALTDAVIASPSVRLMSVMDHMQGNRQNLHRGRWLDRMARALNPDPAAAHEGMDRLPARPAGSGPGCGRMSWHGRGRRGMPSPMTMLDVTSGAANSVVVP